MKTSGLDIYFIDATTEREHVTQDPTRVHTHGCVGGRIKSLSGRRNTHSWTGGDTLPCSQVPPPAPRQRLPLQVSD